MADLLERLTAALANRYAVEREIGRGGMAVVFLAEDLKHHRQVAIKVLHPELAAAVGPERFLREIEAVAGLTHPHVLPLHDSGEASGLLFYVMPYVEGESLRQRLDLERQLPLDEAIRIAQDVADALGHAHRKGLIHRDIKPGNILLEEGHAVVTDFGVARAISEAGGEKVTATGMAVGTPAYMSPEQAAGEDVDERSDIYALGCVLYEMLAGEPPLVGSNPQATAAKRLTDRPTPLPALRDTVSAEVGQVVEKALARAAVDRFDKAPAFSKALGSATESSVVRDAAGMGRSAATSGPEPNTVVVLPFVNMSADPENEYFSDGISDELINLLARIPELRVTSRTSAFSYKGTSLDIPQIAARLKVAHVLEGSVRKAGNQVRVTAQLIEAGSDAPLWSQTWNRSLEDIFAVQDEIAVAVVEQLKVTLLVAAPTVAETEPAAYALFLQARHVGYQLSAEGLEESNAILKQALKVDPDYAPAWSALASNYINQTQYGLLPCREGYGLARDAANRALRVQPDHAAAHNVLSRIDTYDGDLESAARHIIRALELEPTNSEVVAHAALVARHLGRLEKAIGLFEYAVERDPVNAFGFHCLGVTNMFAERYDDAVRCAETVLSLSPRRIAAHNVIARCRLHAGDPEAALAEIRRESSDPHRLETLSRVHHALGHDAESDDALTELAERFETEWSYNVATVFAFRGEADRAFEWLDKAVQYHDPGLSEIPLESSFANIQDDPRWLPFLENIGKSPEQLAAIEFEVRLPQ